MQQKNIKNYKKILLVLIIFFITWIGLHTFVITIDGITDEIQKADIAVVFGNKVDSNGKISDRLKGRLDKSFELYKAGYFDTIIVSGGVDQYNNNEAEIMKSYLTILGIPSGAIIVDSKGINTEATVENTLKIINDSTMGSILVISQFYHITRIKLSFKDSNIKHLYSAHAEYFEIRDVYSLIREFFAYYKYLLAPKNFYSNDSTSE